MELTWFGTAGFRIKTGEHTILIDPYLSRNEKAFPRQPLKPSDIQDGEMIFISHGHFDHIYDVPTICSNIGTRVYCGKGIGETLIRNGMERRHVHEVNFDGEDFDFNGIQAQAFSASM